MNASIVFEGKLSRLRAGLIIVKDGDKILLGEEKDEPGVFSLPGGSINKDEPFVDAAIREAQEEVGITAKNVHEAGVEYCELHDEGKDWVKENVPEEEWWYNYNTVLCIGDYDKEFKGKVDKEDKDPAMKKSAEFYPISEVIDDPSFKEAWKIALRDWGYVDDEPNDRESQATLEGLNKSESDWIEEFGKMYTKFKRHGFQQDWNFDRWTKESKQSFGPHQIGLIAMI